MCRPRVNITFASSQRYLLFCPILSIFTVHFIQGLTSNIFSYTPLRHISLSLTIPYLSPHLLSPPPTLSHIVPLPRPRLPSALRRSSVHQLPTTTVPTEFPAANSQPPPSPLSSSGVPATNSQPPPAPPNLRRTTPNHPPPFSDAGETVYVFLFTK